MDKDADLYVLITERDTHSPLSSHGAIIWEQSTNSAGLEEIQLRASKTLGKYGKQWIAKLEIIEEIEPPPF